MRVVFFGTPDFAVPSLRAVAAAGHELPLVVTQPDRPAGRGYRLAPPPVKVVAEELGLTVEQPPRVAAPEFVARLAALAPAVCVVVAFGQKISEELLGMVAGGWVNVHGSLLPRWRGAAPIARAILAGDQVTGVTTMFLGSGWDTGDMILRRETPIEPAETTGELTERLSRLGAELLVETLAQLGRGEAPRTPQEEALATLAPRLRPEEGELDWSRAARELHDQARAFTPSPGAFTFFRGRRLKVLRTEVPVPGEGPGLPSGTLVLGPAALYVQTGEGLLPLAAVQAEGARPLAGVEFARGARLLPGERCGREG